MTPSYVALLGTIGFLLLVIGILIGRLSDAERSDRSPDEEPLAAAPSASFRHDASAASASESENERDGAGRRGSVPSAVPPPIDDDVDALADDMPDDIEAPAAPSVEAASDAEIGGLSEVEMGAASEVEPMGPPLLEPPILGPGRGEPTTLRQSVQFQRMPRYEVLDNPLIQELHYLIESDLTVHPADIDGYRDVEQVVREAKVLNADELSRASLENAVAKLVGWQFDYRINRFGEVIDWRGGPPATPESDEVTVDGNHGVLVTTVIDEDGWKELATLTFFRPPSDERGERPFERQMTHDFGPLGRWWGMTTFAPRGRDGTLRRFDYRHAMTYEAPEEDRSNGLPFEIVSARLTPRLAAGRITYDTSTEQVREVVERFEVEGEVTARMLGNTIPLQFVEPQTIILQIDDRNRE